MRTISSINHQIYKANNRETEERCPVLLSLLANCLPWVLISLSTTSRVLLPGLTGDLTSFSTLDPHLP